MTSEMTSEKAWRLTLENRYLYISSITAEFVQEQKISGRKTIQNLIVFIHVIYILSMSLTFQLLKIISFGVVSTIKGPYTNNVCNLDANSAAFTVEIN